MNVGWSSKQEVTQPLVFVRPCYCCPAMVPCPGAVPGLRQLAPAVCARCREFHSRLPKIGGDDRRSIRARVPATVPAHVLDGVAW